MRSSFAAACRLPAQAEEPPAVAPVAATPAGLDQRAAPPAAPVMNAPRPKRDFVFRIGAAGVEVVEKLDGREHVVAVVHKEDVKDLLAVDEVLYVACESSGVYVISVSDAEHPRENRLES